MVKRNEAPRNIANSRYSSLATRSMTSIDDWQLSDDDIRMVRAVHEITDKGMNAEIKKTAEGHLRVFRVEKHIVSIG